VLVHDKFNLFLNCITQRTLLNKDRKAAPGTDGFRAVTNLGHIGGTTYTVDDDVI